MATIQWRPEVNALTTPQSYRILGIPRNSAGAEDIAADIAERHPGFNTADILTILNAEDDAIQERLLNGQQVTKSGAFSWSLTFSGRLDSPDDPLPPLDKSLNVNVRVSPPFVAALRRAAQTERLPMRRKAPLVSTAEDSLLGLSDVLNPGGALRLTGDDLAFDREHGADECVIHGTESGRTAQTRLIRVEAGEIILMPDIPAQANPWNNEHTVSVTTRYTEHGTPRTGVYDRMLRSPLALNGFSHPDPPEVGILTGSADGPYVSVTGGAVSADETLRVQVILDMHEDKLLFSLLDMKKDGAAGEEVAVTSDGERTLPGFAGSSVSDLSVRVNDCAALKEMIRNAYSGRLVDVLMIRM